MAPSERASQRGLVKKLLLVLSLVATVACSGSSPTGPSSVSSPSAPTPTPAAAGSGNTADQGGSAGNDGNPSPSGPGAGSASTPQFALQGPAGCVSVGTDIMQWVLNVTDAGPSPLRFVALAHNAPDPGCEHTVDNPRSRVGISGVLNYTPHSAGQTIFTYDPRSFTCGRVQVDVSIFDAQGKETLILGMVVNHGTVCPPPPPPPPTDPLQCAPGGQTAQRNQAVSLRASGGTGVYEWSSLGAPARGAGANFTTAFASTGSYSVTVTSGNATATCVVDVVAPPPPPPVAEELKCSPEQQSALLNQAVHLTARGGDGTFAWSGGGTPGTGSGAAFDTAFATPGTHAVTVRSGGASATCQVAVTTPPPPPPPPALTCTPNIQSVLTNQAATFTAGGGTGTFAWTGGGTPATGTGQAFTTAFATAGTRAVTVTSGNATATCTLEVRTPVTPLICTPAVATIRPHQSITAQASGGDGRYAWTVDGGSPSTGSGPSFTTMFAHSGVYRIWVSSADQTGKCKIYVEGDDEDDDDEDEDDLR